MAAMTSIHATETSDRVDRRLPGTPLGGRGAASGPVHPPRSPSGARRARPPDRRWLGLAIALAAAVHLLLLWTIRLPLPPRPPPTAEVTVSFEPLAPPRPEAEPSPELPAGPTPETGAETATEALPRAAPAALPPDTPIARPRPSGRAPQLRTIPPTTLLAPLTPLEGTPGGIARRSTPVDARRIEIQRAESLLASRLADLPGAGVPREPAVGLAEGGGVTVPVPWGGFVPENRKDRVWREERCRGKDAGEADKPGEREARNSQCD